MAKIVKRRRGTTVEHSAFTGAEGEITIDLDKDTIVVHDNITLGGFPVAREDLSNVDLSNKIGVAELNLPEGTSGQFLSTDGNAGLSFETIDVSLSAVGGDVSGTVANIRSIEEIEALAQGITDGKWTVEDVASQFSVPVGDVQTAYESLAGQAVAQGGRLKNRRFMSSAGPIELAGGGIAELPFNLEMTQEMPSAPAMIEDTEIMEEVDNTDFSELIEMTIEASKGNVENPDTIINQFIEAYGVEEFGRLRDAVLKSIVPDAVTEGMIPGSSGGMDDEVMGMIGEDQRVAVSPGEYIVAADVVSGLGDGSSDAGSAVLDEIATGVRKARTGGRQPAPIDKSKVLPA